MVVTQLKTYLFMKNIKILCGSKRLKLYFQTFFSEKVKRWSPQRRTMRKPETG